MPKVLLISAADLRADLGRTVLFGSGVIHEQARDSAAGRAAARAFTPHLIAIDAALADAAATIRLLRQDPTTCRVAIVAVSRDPYLQDAVSLRAAGANVVVPGDTNPAVWNARLEELLRVPKRRDARGPVHLEPWWPAEGTPSVVEGRAVNISVKGLLLEAPRRPAIGHKLDVRFVLPGSDEEFRTVGEVVRHEGTNRCGVRFLVVRGEARKAIEAFVGGGAPAPATLGATAMASLPAEIDEWEEALRVADTLKTSLLEISLESVILMTHEGLVLDVNPAAERTLGYRREQMVGKSIADTIAGPSERDPHRQRLAHMLATGHSAILNQRLEMTVHHADGSEIPVELQVSSRSVKGKPLYALFLRDQRAALRAEKLQESVQRINEESSAVGDFNGLCVIIRGIVAEVLHSSHFFVAVLDDSSGQLAFSYFVDPADPHPLKAEAVESLAAHVLRTGEPLLASPAVEGIEAPADEATTLEYTRVDWFGVPLKKHGQPFGVVAMQGYGPSTRFTTEDRHALVFMAPAIAVALERKQAEARIHYLAYHDALTRLPNRDLLLDRLQLALAQAVRDRNHMGVLLLDLDRFKVINDSLGHTAGDQVLQEAAQRLDACVRKGDTLARVDGDTFAVVVRGLRDPADVGKVAQILRAALAEPMMIGGRELYATGSIGISVFPEDGADVETLLKNADTALHRAKEQGYDSFRLYDPSMNAEAVNRLRLESGLRRALSRGELVSYYQPVLDITTGEIRGFESLLRWAHPEQGLLLPSEFIALAETTGIIRTIGSWGLRAACAQIRAWHDLGYPRLTVAVNLSARQLQDMSLVPEVMAALKAARLAPASLEIEITETSAMQNADATIHALKALKTVGLRVSIDDFGTGYSSLGQLQHLPIDTVKIDQTFVLDIDKDPRRGAIVTAIIHLGHTLGLRVVAEGVETRGQLAFLAQQKCDRIQGFLLSPALPPDECTALLRDHRPEDWRGPGS